MSHGSSGRTATRVFFHVGAPKTGTTYLQRRLLRNRDKLAADGVLYPYSDATQSFRSMHDFCGTGWGGAPPQQFRGEWELVAGRIREWGGTTAIVSNELFGKATPARIEAGLGSLGDAEVHVVFTARDLARQLVSDWQEHIKHKHTVTLETFVNDLVKRGIDAPKPFGEMFWGLHDPTFVLPRWQHFVPAERIHLVTVPQPGTPKDALWRRFCTVVGLEPGGYDDLTAHSNTSMGVVETELVRRMNRRVGRMSPKEYDPLVRKLLAEKVLGSRSARLTLPREQLPWALERSGQLIADLRGLDYDVVGDLDELMPRPADHADHQSPTGLSAADLAPAAIRAATGLLRQAARQRRTIIELRRELSGEPVATAGPDGVPDRSRGFYSRSRRRARQALAKAARRR